MVTIPVAVDALTVKAAVPSVPKVIFPEPDTLIVVACVAVKAVRTLLVPVETMDKFSIPKTDWVPAVMFDKVTVAESPVLAVTSL
jgi:hypothetical protein